ncbi:MAG: RNase adapter RapZ [Candidatus Howiella sp.]|jgi:UPF0042 nucleotide-binding protein
MELLLVTGMSGAGKSTAANALEDIGYYCVDNMLPKMLPVFADICKKSEGQLSKIAIITDIRVGEEFNDMDKILDQLKADGYDYKILFLNVSDEVAVRRYKETRRKHPLGYPSVLAAVEEERQILKSVYARADYILDTSQTTAGQLKKQITDIFLGDTKKGLSIQVMSFGFKYGPALEADLVFDVRCLPNPYYVSELRPLTGLDDPIREYVMQYPQSRTFAKRLLDLLDYAVPLYCDEGKSQLIIAMGCTGGKHRSVTFAELVYKHFIEKGYRTSVNHRDINKI